MLLTHQPVCIVGGQSDPGLHAADVPRPFHSEIADCFLNSFNRIWLRECQGSKSMLCQQSYRLVADITYLSKLSAKEATNQLPANLPFNGEPVSERDIFCEDPTGLLLQQTYVQRLPQLSTSSCHMPGQLATLWTTVDRTSLIEDTLGQWTVAPTCVRPGLRPAPHDSGSLLVCSTGVTDSISSISSIS